MQLNQKQKADALTRRLLKKWEGGEASICYAQVGHKILKIRVVIPKRHGYLEITCGDCEYIAGPFKWLNASFEMVEHASGSLLGYILQDERNRFSIHCGLVGAEEKSYT
jgi:hypothetical protein